MIRLVRSIIILGILVPLCLVGCREKSDAQSNQEKIKVEVRTAKVSMRTLYRKKVFTGVMEAYQKADIAPNPPGTVQRLYCRVGDSVKKGQVLAKMDDAGLVQAIARFQPMKSQFERSRQLFENGAVSKATYESIESQYLATKRQVESLQENTTIKAPFSGVVTGIAVEDGEMYSPQMSRAMAGSGPGGLIQIARLDPLKIDLQIDDRTIALVKKGMDVDVRTDAIPDSVFSGSVLWVNPLANPSSRTFEARVLVPNASRELKAGYFAEVSVVIDRKDSVLSVPSSALLENRVFTVDQARARSREVNVGFQGDSFIEILEGLTEGDEVVVEGNRALPDSALVDIRETTSKAHHE